jgi:phosphoglycerate dehydrogenase-like enzyme
LEATDSAMESLRIVIAAPSFDNTLPHAREEDINRIREVNPGVEVVDVSSLVAAEIHKDYSNKDNLNKMLARADVVFGMILPRNLASRSPGLKWVQMMSAGVDRLMETDIWGSKVIITGVSGIHAVPIGEFVLGLMLMFAKDMPRCFRMQEKHEWRRSRPSLLHNKTVGIIGLGHIGGEIARLSKSFGMSVIATKRSVSKRGRLKNVDLLLPRPELSELLKQSDFVVLSVPLTSDTNRIIGEQEIRLMKPNARIINIGRGELIDEDALIQALDQGTIAGAGLDVTAIEPLPPESRLWDMENVILSPHISGGMEDYMGRATDLFCDNIRRFLAGRQMRNVVQRRRGY